jgi:hypothetical protein
MTKLCAIDGSEPHPSYGGWANFLANHCEVRDTLTVAGEGDVIHYGSVNCNYIVLPNGLIIQNYGYQGRILMIEIQEKGYKRILAEFAEVGVAHDQLIESIANLTNSLGRLTGVAKT